MGGGDGKIDSNLDGVLDKTLVGKEDRRINGKKDRVVDKIVDLVFNSKINSNNLDVINWDSGSLVVEYEHGIKYGVEDRVFEYSHVSLEYFKIFSIERCSFVVYS